MRIRSAPGGLVAEWDHELITSLEVVLPEPWVRAPVEQELGAHTFRAEKLVLHVRFRNGPRPGVDVEVRSLDRDRPTSIPSPRLRLETPGTQLPWIGGSTGRVLLPADPTSAVFRQWRGECASCPDSDAEISLFPDPMWVLPGQGIGSGWRLETTPDGSLPTDPSWVPAHTHVERDEEIVLKLPDAGLVADTLNQRTEDDVTFLTGETGLHQIQLSDATGTTSLELGWHAPLDEIARMALAGKPAADLAAWLLVSTSSRQELGDPAVADQLDLLLGEAFEQPTLFSVLAGRLAAIRTDLPVEDEVATATRQLVHSTDSSEVFPVLVAQGLRLNAPIAAEDEQTSAWWAALLRADDAMVLQVLDWVDHGRVTSVGPRHGARGLALAELWLATHDESRAHLEIAGAAASYRARLLSEQSQQFDPKEIAWLLLAQEFSSQG